MLLAGSSRNTKQNIRQRSQERDYETPHTAVLRAFYYVQEQAWGAGLLQEPTKPYLSCQSRSHPAVSVHPSLMHIHLRAFRLLLVGRLQGQMAHQQKNHEPQ